jgi:hypothetical protein
MNLFEYLSYIILFAIWFFFFFISLIAQLLSHISEESVGFDKVYDKCNALTAKYTYVLRFKFGETKKYFTFEGTTFTVHVLNKDFEILTTIRISRSMTAKIFVIKNFSTVFKFLFLRREPLSGISHLIVNHDSVGEVVLVNVEIQEVNSTKANVAYVETAIKNLKDKKLETKQCFPSATKEFREIESELKVSSKMTFCEFLGFLFMAINFILISCVFIIPCNEKKKLCADYKNGFLSSLFAGIAASINATIIFTLFIVIYIGFIKYFYAKKKSFWILIRILYLLLIAILSIGFGVSAAVFAANNNRFQKVSDDEKHEFFWIYAIGIGSFLFVSISLPILSIIAYILGFFGELQELDFEDSEKVGIKSMAHKSTIKRGDNKFAKKPIETIGESYYKQISNKNVKSISGYFRINTKPKTEDNKEEDDIDDGDQYYEQVMKNKKVKSVSQYTGFNN